MDCHATLAVTEFMAYSDVNDCPYWKNLSTSFKACVRFLNGFEKLVTKENQCFFHFFHVVFC